MNVETNANGNADQGERVLPPVVPALDATESHAQQSMDCFSFQIYIFVDDDELMMNGSRRTTSMQVLLQDLSTITESTYIAVYM